MIELESIYKQLLSFKDNASYEQYDKDLNEHLEQFNGEILIKKEKKFHRDKNAFQESKAYNWKNTAVTLKLMWHYLMLLLFCLKGLRNRNNHENPKGNPKGMDRIKKKNKKNNRGK